jgi:hypothetical protein
MEDLAVFHAWAGDAEGALEWMGQAFEHSPAGFEVRLYESALFDRIRRSPGFAEAAGRLFQGRFERVRDQAQGIAFH